MSNKPRPEYLRGRMLLTGVIIGACFYSNLRGLITDIMGKERWKEAIDVLWIDSNYSKAADHEDAR